MQAHHLKITLYLILMHVLLISPLYIYFKTVTSLLLVSWAVSLDCKRSAKPMTDGFPSILSRGCTIIYFTARPWLDVAVVSVSFCYRLHSETFSYRNLPGHPSTRLDQCGNASAAHSRGTERRPSLPCRLRLWM